MNRQSLEKKLREQEPMPTDLEAWREAREALLKNMIEFQRKAWPLPDDLFEFEEWVNPFLPPEIKFYNGPKVTRWTEDWELAFVREMRETWKEIVDAS